MITTQTIRNFAAIYNDGTKSTDESPTDSSNDSDPGGLWIERLVRQSKKLSQLIATSWMTEEADYPGEDKDEVKWKIAKAKAIRKIFLDLRVGNQPTYKQDAYSKLEQLFLGKAELDAQDCPDAAADSDKKILFGKIFDPKELERYQFEITWNAFDGKLIEHPQVSMKQIKQEGKDNKQKEEDKKAPFFTLVLPYPPQPPSFKCDIKDNHQFSNWIKAPVDVDDKYQKPDDPFPPVAYAPLTTC